YSGKISILAIRLGLASLTLRFQMFENLRSAIFFRRSHAVLGSRDALTDEDSPLCSGSRSPSSISRMLLPDSRTGPSACSVRQQPVCWRVRRKELAPRSGSNTQFAY